MIEVDPDAGGGCLLVRRLTSVLPWFQQGGESDGFFHLEGQPQRLPQPPEVRQQPARKVTLTKGALQQPQHPPVGAHVHSAGPPGIKSIQGIHPAKKVIMHGRGRGMAGAMGRGRLMPNKQNLRVVECKPQPCVVSVEGLSSSTTDAQLKSLLMSVGPIQVVTKPRARVTGVDMAARSRSCRALRDAAVQQQVLGFERGLRFRSRVCRFLVCSSPTEYVTYVSLMNHTSLQALSPTSFTIPWRRPEGGMEETRRPPHAIEGKRVLSKGGLLSQSRVLWGGRFRLLRRGPPGPTKFAKLPMR
ncbi:hypothetical protein J1605_016049 [Eschrichtius robustus]|uniref:RNA-binding protein 33 n=1 Tax=Eschrichtius robustus TaxID=9764 RepID=A0AB34G9J2_ESCRO|nr:hypothetical protein J1605_016049 [Eschrichtius robustus]